MISIDEVDSFLFNSSYLIFFFFFNPKPSVLCQKLAICLMCFIVNIYTYVTKSYIHVFYAQTLFNVFYLK